jgi:hypothetical protein
LRRSHCALGNETLLAIVDDVVRAYLRQKRAFSALPRVAITLAPGYG